ncbi:methyl-accepting chemotaxis protein [Cytobacillus sp. IB215665]|uniref:methyl-accepting chemotaxis protein n=1 Tax=Cytobacillus sp. IB215665 TaxID=3097357 RepID=UPI002A0EDE60|nr:methyl-accepting chemotaxis protein [Cytobacillus sp. IB215665]MDX8365457.1 methyl-accepting chemotaxis protein [Cytobacillus sp. IB215665]
MFKNTSVKKKLLILFCTPLLLSLLSSSILLYLNDRNVEKLIQSLYDTSFQTNSLILDADKDLYQALVGFQSLTIEGNSDEYIEETRLDIQSNITRAVEKVDESLTIIQEQSLQDITQPSIEDNTQEDTSSQTDTNNITIQQLLLDFKEHFGVWAKITEEKDPSYTLYKDSLPVFEAARDNLKISGDILNDYALNNIDDIHLSNKTTKIWFFSIFLFFFLMITGGGLLFISGMIRTIHEILFKIQDVSEGNLQVELKSKYTNSELGKMLKGSDVMVSKLRELIFSINEHSKTVQKASIELSQSSKESSAATNHVADNIQTITGGIEVQANMIDETSTSVEEMATGVQKIAESTSYISMLSEKTDHQADKGNEVVIQLQNQIESMMNTIKHLATIVTSLNQRSDKIGSIIDNITTFANQTNLLSLNASIEAARAGEQGRGFAVVAEEIRKLATSSLESAESIQTLIVDTQSEISNVTESMKSAVEESAKSNQSMVEVSEDFKIISKHIKDMGDHIHETSAITQQLAASSQEVASSMANSKTTSHDIFAKSQNVVAAAEEQLALIENMDAAAHELMKVVDQLNKSIAIFKV